MRYEYLALPAPSQMKSTKGQKTAVERLAVALTNIINEMADEGWEFMRTETLTVEDRPHRFSKSVERIETVIVFRRDFDYVETEAPQPSFQRQREEPMVEPEPEDERPEAPVAAEEARPPRQQPFAEPEERHSGPSLGGITRD